MSNDAIDLEVRLAAIEFVLTSSFKVALLAAGGGTSEAIAIVQSQRRSAAQHLRDLTMKGVDPTISDHFSDELQRDVDRLLSGVEENLERMHRRTAP